MQILKSYEKILKFLWKNSNFSQNFSTLAKNSKRNPKKFKEKFKKLFKKSKFFVTKIHKFKNLQNFFENSFFHLLAVGGGALYY